MSLAALIGEDVITVQRQTASKDSSGGVARTWTDTYVDVPCRVEDASASAMQIYAMRQMVVTHRLFTQQSGIGMKDRIKTSDGRTLVVEDALKRRGIGGMETFYVVMAGELRAGS